MTICTGNLTGQLAVAAPNLATTPICAAILVVEAATAPAPQAPEEQHRPSLHVAQPHL
jgi:hypothetical protein